MSARGAPPDAKVAFVTGCTLVVLANLIETEPVTWALAPLFLGCFIFAALRSPLRSSLLVLMFFAYVLENPNDGMGGGYWHTPGAVIGFFFFLHLKAMTGISFLFLSPLEYAIFFLLGLSLYRSRSGSTVDSFGRVRSPSTLMRLCRVSLLTSLWMALLGLSRGGVFNFALWQLDKVVYLPILAYLFDAGLQGPRDIVPLGKTLLWAGAYRAGLAAYIRTYVEVPTNEWGESFMETATTHHDSMLFAAATLLVILPVVERVGRGSGIRALLILPILVWGMIANDRRMVWVQIGMVLVTLYFVTPPNTIKRRIKRAMILLSPAIAAYISVGWSAPKNPLFKPVGIIKSVVEPSTDSSSLWREIENYDLLFTFRQGPLLGQGYGLGFWEVIPLPAVNYSLERYCPHNAIFGIWAFGGYVGYTGLVLCWAGCVYCAMRAYRHTKVPLERVASIMCIGSVLIYMIQCYGDMGLGAWAGVFLVAPSIAMAGKLAVSTGSWTAAPAKRSKVPAASR
jgi:hypothetical protein